jgi:hypothetical protein
MLNGPDVSRPSVSSETLLFNFTTVEPRTQRVSDGTLQIKGVRFEIPSRFRHSKRLKVGYQSWDLSRAYLLDARTEDNLGRIYPQDKIKNAAGNRRQLTPLQPTGQESSPPVSPTASIPPLLRRLLSDYAATGLPPAYLPREEITTDAINDEALF